MPVEEWSEESFERELAGRERVLVLFYADWCPFSRAFLPDFDRAEPEASVPFVRANIADSNDPRWKRHGVQHVPTLVYFEHGEPLERVDPIPHGGLTRRDLEDFLETVEGIQEEPVLPKRMHGPRRM
jgi:thioredoxin 1